MRLCRLPHRFVNSHNQDHLDCSFAKDFTESIEICLWESARPGTCTHMYIVTPWGSQCEIDSIHHMWSLATNSNNALTLAPSEEVEASLSKCSTFSYIDSSDHRYGCHGDNSYRCCFKAAAYQFLDLGIYYL